MPATLHKPDVLQAPSIDDVLDRYDSIYRDAHGDAKKVPWHREGANAPLVAWLNAEAPAMVRPGARAIVVGCGLGADVAELALRGYDAVGFDICPTAIEWARKRNPGLEDCFFQGDLLDPPSNLRRRFDLVVEVYTLQSLPPELRPDAARGLEALLRPHGKLVTVCRARDLHEAAPDEPPYPIAREELLELMDRAGLTPTRDPDDFHDDEDPPIRRLRCAFHRTNCR